MQDQTTKTPTRDETAAQLGEMLGLLMYLKTSLDDVRAQLAGARKPQYTVEEVATMFGRSPYTIRQWVAAKKLRAIRVSGTGPKGRLLIPREEIDRLL